MYVLHGVPDFANLAVHVVLEELGVPYSTDMLDIDAGDLKTPAHLARHPLGLVPVLQTPDGAIFETAAILLWLSEHHGALAPPPGSAERAAFLQWLVFTNNGLHAAAMDLIHPERPAGEGAARAVADIAHDKLRQRLTILDRMVAGTAPSYLSSDTPSVLGHYLGMLMRWIRAFPAYPDHAMPASDFPALLAVIQAHESRPAAIRAARAEGLTARFYSDPEV
jgi:glutathione S-transferase